MTTELKSQIDCLNLTSDEINKKVTSLISDGIQHILLMNAPKEKNLLEGISGDIKIDLINDVGDFFGNFLLKAKVVLNGSAGSNSCGGIKSSKITLNGSCGSFFGAGSQESEFYIYENCEKNSFHGIKNSKVVIGGLPGNNLGKNIENSKVVILNLKGGTIFLDETNQWFENLRSCSVFIRGNIKSSSDKYKIEKVNENDEDTLLPLISEFSRLFGYSLSEIKSKEFYKVV